MRRILIEHPLINLLYHTVIVYKAPVNLNYFWNFGSLAFICLFIQIVSGIFLAMHYTAHVDFAFLSVEHIMRDVQYGWLLRYIHANGASAFFFVVYIHIFRGLYYGSYIYPRQALWVVGVLIFLLMILTAFMGYVLPWGQMSFWAATVITNLASAIPIIGTTIVIWLWGGFAVDNATLNRFYSLHYLMPFIIVGLVLLHIILLHEHGSNNPLGLIGNFVVASKSQVDGISFSPYFTLKDLYGLLIFGLFFIGFVMFIPNYAGHPDNYIPGNPMVTPAHIVPEWYFLPFYAMLRSIPNKLGGVIVLIFSIVVLALLPFVVTQNVRSNEFKPFQKIGFWFILSIYLLLGWIGGMPIETPYYQVGQIVTLLYFFFFLIFLPFISKLEALLLGFNTK
jgi:quinol-cytochrome oxidoreductase complex cytochrome b subunit